MKLLVRTIFVMLVIGLPVFAQETESKTGFQWLKQFEGDWLVQAKTPDAKDDDKPIHTVGMTARTVGQHWVVSTQRGKMMGMDFEALQTVGYDAKEGKYVGTWVDSTSGYTWQLAGSLDETGKKLTLQSKGADMSDPDKTRLYRDIYEFKSADEIATLSQMKNDDGKWQTFMTSKMTRKKAKGDSTMTSKPTVTPFLMFTGKAQEAIEFYKSVFSDVNVEGMVKYKAGEAGKEGTIQLAKIEIAGQKVMCTDSPPVHDFTFTPSFSFFVECESLESLKDRFTKLSEGGKVMMPVGDYGFSEQFAWCSDKYGVSWQLNLNSKLKLE